VRFFVLNQKGFLEKELKSVNITKGEAFQILSILAAFLLIGEFILKISISPFFNIFCMLFIFI